MGSRETEAKQKLPSVRFGRRDTSLGPENSFSCKDDALVCKYSWEDHTLPYFHTKKSTSLLCFGEE